MSDDDQSKMDSLIQKLQSDPKLSKKLDLLVDSVCKDRLSESKKRKDVSPLRVKTVKAKLPKISEENSSIHSSSRSGSPNEKAPGETSKRGASPSDSESEQHDEEDVNSENDFSNLENFLMEDCEESDRGSESSDEDLEILGGPQSASWTISQKSFDFYKKVADIELKKELIDSIKKEFQAHEDVEPHFAPPRFSPSLWSTVQSSKADTFKLKCLYKVQEHIYLALKPLLSCLDSVDRDSKSKIAKSIQLLSSSNLLLNRFRRSTLAPHLKPELRKQILALPISHDSFFGDDFSKATDSLVKEQSAMEKVISKKPLSQRLGNKNFSNNQNQKKFFRNDGFQRGGNSKGFGNRGKRYQNSYPGSKNYSKTNSGGNYKENSSSSGPPSSNH